MNANRIILAMLVATLPGVARLDAADRHSTSVSLRSTVTSTRPVPTLDEVLLFDNHAGDLPLRLAGQPIAAGAASKPAAFSYDQLITRLRELNVDLSTLTVHGASVCRITYPPPSSSTPRHPAVEVAEFASPPESPANASPAAESAPVSLAHFIRRFVAADEADLGGTPQIEFERAGRDLLSLTTPPFDFNLKPVSGGKLGLREFNVVVSKKGKVQRMTRIGLRVGLLKKVLVAARPLNAGTLIGPQDVRLEDRLFENGDAAAIEQSSAVVGRRLKRFVPAGGMLKPDAMQDAEVVRRTQPVTVVSRAGSVRVNLVGTAIDGGCVGDEIRVRVGESRKEWREVRGVITGPALVEMGDGK